MNQFQRWSGRQLKRHVRELLGQNDLAESLNALIQLPARQVVNPLFGLFCNQSERLRWHSISAMGAVVAHMAPIDPEGARVIMRRLMWTLNDESGGIGWGSPEALGEIMARCPQLACEYACILVSYVNPDGNYLEEPRLQRGLLWGLDRLAQTHPELVAPASPFLPPFWSETDATLCGLALQLACRLGLKLPSSVLNPLMKDARRFSLYDNGRFVTIHLHALAQRLASRQNPVPL